MKIKKIKIIIFAIIIVIIVFYKIIFLIIEDREVKDIIANYDNNPELYLNKYDNNYESFMYKTSGQLIFTLSVKKDFIGECRKELHKGDYNIRIKNCGAVTYCPTKKYTDEWYLVEYCND